MLTWISHFIYQYIAFLFNACLNVRFQAYKSSFGVKQAFEILIEFFLNEHSPQVLLIAVFEAYIDFDQYDLI